MNKPERRKAIQEFDFAKYNELVEQQEAVVAQALDRLWGAVDEMGAVVSTLIDSGDGRIVRAAQALNEAQDLIGKLIEK